ncbi:MAG: RloB family protein [Candidatus Cloacimonetes bacterium]|nr:RloB family protein [Candidatus Cloacimonadota bacterium]
MKYQRKYQERYPGKIFIFTEGSVTEQKYFEKFIEYFKIPQARVEVVDRKSHCSSPKDVLNYVIDFQQDIKKQEPVISKYYDYWLIMDTDRWEKNLYQAIDEAFQRKYGVAVSDPCFEIWYLLHYETALWITQNSPLLITKSSINTALHAHNVSGDVSKDFLPHTESAIQEAETLDANKQKRLPEQPGTRVYLLARKLYKLAGLVVRC